jgi:DNA-binding IclR family transcriptional regulator
MNSRQVLLDDNRPASANYHANALARGLGLLELLAARSHPLSLGDFAVETGLPKSTLVRLLSVLCEMDYAVRVDERPSYRLGHKVQPLASAYVSMLDLSEVSEPYLARVAHHTGQTANLGVLDGDRVLHVSVSEPQRPLRFVTGTGMRDYAHCTGLGKQLLARIDPALVPLIVGPEPFEAFTDRTITTMNQLTRELRRIERHGYAVDDNERNIGLHCVAVPVEVDGECVAAVSVSGPSAEFTPKRQEDYVDQLHEEATRMAADPDFVAAFGVVRRSLRPAGTG